MFQKDCHFIFSLRRSAFRIAHLMPIFCCQKTPTSAKRPSQNTPHWAPGGRGRLGLKPHVQEVSIPVFLTYLKSGPKLLTNFDFESMIKYSFNYISPCFSRLSPSERFTVPPVVILGIRSIHVYLLRRYYDIHDGSWRNIGGLFCEKMLGYFSSNKPRYKKLSDGIRRPYFCYVMLVMN